MSTVEFSHIASTYIENMDGLYAYALHMGFDDQTSMDAIHDVFYKLCIRHSSLDEIENLKSYLFRALRNRLVDLKRSNREIPSLFTANEKNEEILSFNLNVNYLSALYSGMQLRRNLWHHEYFYRRFPKSRKQIVRKT